MAAETLAELQTRVEEMERRRGFESDSVVTKCLLLAEEVGELAKAVRARSGIAMERGVTTDMGGELADVLIVLCTIANRAGVQLGDAVTLKMRGDESRDWCQAAAVFEH